MTDMINKKKYYILGGLILGALLFILIYGPSSLVPDNVMWLYNSPSPDLVQAQLGFDHYRARQWEMPPGVFADYPKGSIASVVYSASIPVMAIFFKLINPVLPDFFQYIGIWDIICFMLQGMLAALLLRKLGIGLLPSICAIPMFICTTALLFRTFHHDSLAAHWLFLLAFLMILYQDRLESTALKAAAWSALGILALVIHVYFWPMLAVIMLSFLIYDSLRSGKAAGNAAVLVCVIICTLIVWYLIGGMIITADQADGGGLGLFSLNLLSLFNSNGHSLYLKPLPHFEGQGLEDTAYLGMGGFVLLASFLLLSLKNAGRIRIHITKHKKEYIFTAAAVLVLVIISLGPRVTFGSRILFDYTGLLPDLLLKAGGIFRSTARFFWPVQYLMLILMIYVLSRTLKVRHLVFLLFLCSLIQYMDVVPGTARLYSGAYEIQHGFSSEYYVFLEKTIKPDVKNVSMILEPFSPYVETSLFAARRKVPINVAYLSRGSSWDVSDVIEEWNSSDLKADTLYCIPIDNLDMIEEHDLPPGWRWNLVFPCYTVIANENLIVEGMEAYWSDDSEEFKGWIRNVKEQKGS